MDWPVVESTKQGEADDVAVVARQPVATETSEKILAADTAQVGSPPLAQEVPASSRWDRATKRTVIVLMMIVALIVIWLSTAVLPILIFAAIIAYLLNPIVDLGDRLRIPRSLTTIFVFLLLLVGFILLPVLLIPVLLNQLTSLGNYNPQVITSNVIRWFSNSIDNLPDIIMMWGFEFPIGNTLQELQGNFQQYLVIPTVGELLTYMQQLIGTTTTVVSSTAVIGISVVGGIVQFFFTFLVVFFVSLYLTKDAPTIRSYVQGLFPPSYQPEFAELLRRIGHIWQAFFRGQIILSLVIGTTTWLALEAAGMPGALILGILAGTLEIVPNLGPTLAMIPAVIVALIQGSDVLGPLGIDNVSFALITIAIYFIIQQLENNIVVPRVIGDSVNLHPVVVICGVVVGLNVGGILGAFLAAPVLASLRVIGGYIHAKLLDYPPFQGGGFPTAKPRQRSYRRTVKGEDLRRDSWRKTLTRARTAVESVSDAAFAEPNDHPTDEHNNTPTSAIAST